MVEADGCCRYLKVAQLIQVGGKRKSNSFRIGSDETRLGLQGAESQPALGPVSVSLSEITIHPNGGGGCEKPPPLGWLHQRTHRVCLSSLSSMVGFKRNLYATKHLHLPFTNALPAVCCTAAGRLQANGAGLMVRGRDLGGGGHNLQTVAAC